MTTAVDRAVRWLRTGVVLAAAAVAATTLQVRAHLQRDASAWERTQATGRALLQVEQALLDLPKAPGGPRHALLPLAAGVQRLTPLIDVASIGAEDLARLRDLVARAHARSADDGPPAGGLPIDEFRAVLVHLLAAQRQADDARLAARAADVVHLERQAGLLAGALAVLAMARTMLARRGRTARAGQRAADAARRQILERQVADQSAALTASRRELSVQRARLAGIFDTTADAILTADARQVIVEASASAARLFRCNPAELIGAPLERLIPARSHAVHRRELSACGAGRPPPRAMSGTQEVMAVRADGQEFPIDARISHLTRDGESFYTVILRDILPRRRDEAALRDSRAQLEAALSSMNDAVCICDTEGRLLEFNEAFATFHRFGGRQECATSLAAYARLLDCALADGSPAAHEVWALPRALRGEAATNVEYALRRKDTGQSWIGSYSFAPIRDSAGGIVGAVCTARDVTASKLAQSELAASHATLQHLLLNQHHVQEDERKRIARELHDDLQQSLAAIRMYTVAILERMADGRGDPAALQAPLARIDQLSADALSSTRRIVSDLRPEPLEDLGLVAALEAMCVQHAERTGTDCTFELAPGACEAELGGSAIVSGLYRIAQEALNNVAKHARATTVRLRLDCSPHELVLLRISDDGVGLDRLDPRRTGSYGLRGMGERARALGGQLRVEGRPGQGTTVEILVPIFGARATSSAQAVDAAMAATGAARAPDGDTARPHGVWGHPLQAVIDALAGEACVLDAQGVIHWVNKAWRERATAQGVAGLEGCGPGVDYLDVCRRSVLTDASVAPVLQGLREVLAGRRPTFTAEYACAPPGEHRHWFRLHAASITGGMTLISHNDLTRRPPTAAAAREPAADAGAPPA
ncbi:MAG: hypothetical protein RL223_973 [Pseudomonadota bacterium]